MERIKVAVVGVGHIGAYHAEKYAKLDSCDLVYVVDINEQRGREIAAKFSAQYIPCYKDLVGKVSAVSIAVDTKRHLEVAKFLLENNIHVLLEKPFTSTSRDAKKLQKIAIKNSLVLMAGYSEKFTPIWKDISKLIEDPIFIHSNRLSVSNNRCPDINVIQDLMSHDINIIQFLISENIKSIDMLATSFVKNRLDFCSVRVNFENNIFALLVASKLNYYNSRNFFIHQKNSNIEIDFINKKAVYYPSNGGNIIIEYSEHDNIMQEISIFTNAICEKNKIVVSDSLDAIKTLLAIEKIEEKIA